MLEVRILDQRVAQDPQTDPPSDFYAAHDLGTCVVEIDNYCPLWTGEQFDQADDG